MKNLKEIKRLLIVASIVLLFVITIGVTYAFFSYVKDGSTENTIKSGSITFLYDEINQSGNSIGIEDALPTSDTLGKQQTNYFNFKIVSTASTTTSIPYEITLRQKQGTDNIGDKVKVYLSKIDSYNSQVNNEEEVVTSMFSDLTTVTHNNYSEKLLHSDIVPASNTRYEQYYRLKMWLDASTNLSSENYANKTFTVMVNVYSNGHVLDANSGNASISTLSVGGTLLTVTSTENDIDYYEATLPEGTEQTTISVETADYTRVQVIKTQSDYQTPIATSNNITRLSQTLSKVVQLTDGSNYFKIITISEDGTEKESHMKIKLGRSVQIFGNSYIIEPDAPTLTTTSDVANENGLYSMNVTNGFGGADGTTYFFRGNVNNNYVSFADQTWRIVRINEDGTIRLILDSGINSNTTYQFARSYNYYSDMYYSNNADYIQDVVDTWYTTNITGTYDNKVAKGNYFCEAAKTKYDTNWTSGDATMTAYSSYIPNFKCITDGNNKGLINISAGLINYDELVFAGGYPLQANSNYYLFQGYSWFTMSPNGFQPNVGRARIWYVDNEIGLDATGTRDSMVVRPVINLKADVTATGTGTSTDPYVIQ